jgi:hypothetical protein
MFTKATKKRSRARVALCGVSGSGKTYTGLVFATTLANGNKVAVIDSEAGSASKYADLFEFDVCELSDYSPETYVKTIHAAEMAGYSAILIDSLSHAWMGKNGALALVDKAAERSKSGNSYMAWRDVTPLHNRLIDAMLQSPCHIVVTMRSKTEYVLEDNGKGQKVPRKIGMAPVQRDGMEYEFDVVGDMSLESNKLVVTKTRCPAIADEVVIRPTAEFAKKILDWVSDGVEAPEPEKPTFAPPTPKQTPEQAIAASRTPEELAALLNGWLAKVPVGKEPAKWQTRMEAAEAHQIKMIDAGTWTTASADPSQVVIMSIFNQLSTASQGEEAFR